MVPWTNLTPNVQTREQYRDKFDEEGPNLHLGFQTQTPAQAVREARRGSKGRGKQPTVVLETLPTQVVVTEGYLQSLLAQITSQGGVPPAYPGGRNHGLEVDLNNIPTHSVSGSSHPAAKKDAKRAPSTAKPFLPGD